jgi:hypothetical protein
VSNLILVKGSPRIPHFSLMPASEICIGCATFIDPLKAHYIIWDKETEQYWRQCLECRKNEKLAAEI